MPSQATAEKAALPIKNARIPHRTNASVLKTDTVAKNTETEKRMPMILGRLCLTSGTIRHVSKTCPRRRRMPQSKGVALMQDFLRRRHDSQNKGRSRNSHRLAGEGNR